MAIDKTNATHHTILNDLDVMVLNALKEAKKGLRTKEIMLAIRNRIWMPRYSASITRLLDLEYIICTHYKRWGYYSITLKGRRIVDELNQCMTDICAAK
jgi:hypothetical protein